MKKEIKIRRLLGDNYHLYVSREENKTTWKLFEKFKLPEFIYMSEENKPIMTSEDSPEKDLLKFAKKHGTYDFEKACLEKTKIIAHIAFIMAIVNLLFIRSTELSKIIWITDIYLIIDLIVYCVVLRHNLKNDMKLFEKKYELVRKVLSAEEEKDENKE